MGKEQNLKVLHIDLVREWRGGQQQIAYLVNGLAQAGIFTELICPPDSELARRFKRQKLPFYAVKMRHAWDPLAAFRIAVYARKKKFNIIHAHSSHALSLAFLIKLFYPSLKLVASRRVDFSVNKPVIGSIKYNNPLIDCIVCISENIADVLLKDGVNRQRLRIIHSGIDLENFEDRGDSADLKRELGIPEEHRVVGTVAALVGHKDYPTLLRAAAKVCQSEPDVTFCAVGEGNDRSQLTELHNELRLGKRFLFVGFRRDPGRFYRLFDLFVLASHKEGLGTSVLDAQVHGLPVVATRAGGIPEMIRHGFNGYLVEKKNPESLAEAILELLRDPLLRKKLGQNARQSVKEFSVRHTVLKHIDLYRSLIR
ncbi:MAG: glycosyltransferase family 4 protein [Calditrichaeota bacterium]|nr:glycosyltransferase family 4 protein [Calditrichota bacterium]